MAAKSNLMVLGQGYVVDIALVQNSAILFCNLVSMTCGV